ncbi:MAG: hypothetical protein V1720_04100 [bacterium]
MDALYISVFAIIVFAVLYFPASKIWNELFFEKVTYEIEEKPICDSPEELKLYKDAA